LTKKRKQSFSIQEPLTEEERAERNRKCEEERKKAQEEETKRYLDARNNPKSPAAVGRW
jgi:hypothetical protein